MQKNTLHVGSSIDGNPNAMNGGLAVATFDSHLILVRNPLSHALLLSLLDLPQKKPRILSIHKIWHRKAMGSYFLLREI